MRFSHLLLPLMTSLTVGAIVGIYFHKVLIIAVVIGVLGIMLLIKATFSKLQLITIISLCFICISVGLIRGEVLYKSLELPAPLLSSVEKYTNIEGIIINNPELKKDKQSFILESNGIKIETSLPRTPLLDYGTKLSIYGRLRVPENFSVTNDKEVRYTALLRAKGIMLLLDGKKYEIISKGNGNNFISKIYEFKRNALTLIERIPSPESNLLFSMVFGGKSTLPSDLLNYFQLAGLLHIVVLSGQNLTIISFIAVKIFSYSYGFRLGHLLAILAIIIYSIMGGLESATLRALFMSVLLITGLLLGRLAQFGRILYLSILCMLIYNPYLLFDDSSFQLSVLAFLGILYISPVVELWLIKNNVNQKLSSYIGAICGAQLAVLPYIIYSSQMITPYALIANFLSLIVVGVITVYGVIVTLVGMLSAQIFDVITIPLIFLLKYIIYVAEWISNLPLASIVINMKGWFVISIYLLGIYYVYNRWKKNDLTPLSMFTMKENKKQIDKGLVPWIEPDDERSFPDKNINEDRVVSWN